MCYLDNYATRYRLNTLAGKLVNILPRNSKLIILENNNFNYYVITNEEKNDVFWCKINVFTQYYTVKHTLDY